MLNSDIAISYNSKISYEKDFVFKMVSDALYMLGLDKEHYKDAAWNPLGEYVRPGDLVVIKPNLVMHENPSGEGLECLYTQASVVRAIIEYVVIALKGKGSIIVGDAPLHRCHFDELIEQSGYKSLIEEYRKKGVNIKLVDFRNTIAETVHGVIIEKKACNRDSIVVDVGNQSSFFGLSEERIRNMRVTSYDPRILQKHHTLKKHEYSIAKEILDADVFINVPKPKTHRKAGVTGALKNLVGINSSKEYLPHHTRQSVNVKGDAFLHKDSLLTVADECADRKCKAESAHHYIHAQIYRYVGGICRRIGQMKTHEKFSEGSWYGNDTIWRTICDLNKILQYADKTGKMCSERQRQILNIGDMIISGENDGPLKPSRKEAGIIIAGEDPCSFDEVVTALMGFEGQKIPTIKHMLSARPKIYFNKKFKIVSNNKRWNGKELTEIYRKYSLNFVPNPGWREVL